jgi:hypothetical protein
MHRWTPGVKESPRVASDGPAATQPDANWAFYKIVLQSPMMGEYRLNVSARRTFTAGSAEPVKVEPILAAGAISDQNGFIAVCKADTLALGEPSAGKGLISGDPSMASDLPYQPHRDALPALAFRYAASPFELAIPVAVQAEADVFTVIATAAVIEQVLARDGTLNAQATFMLSASRGDRLIVTLPAGEAKKLYEIKLNGKPATIEEVPGKPDERIVRLPATAGQVSKSTLQISYGLDSASAGSLAAPSLAGVQVRQTIWRLWLPQGDRVLNLDRNFTRLGTRQADELLRNSLGDSGATWTYAGQGAPVSVMRTGPAGTLSVWRVSNEAAAIATWAIILLIGVLMLWLGGYARSVLVVAIAAVVMVLYLVRPLLVEAMSDYALLPAILVVVLWSARWVFVRSRKAKAPPAGGGAFPPAPSGPDTPPLDQKLRDLAEKSAAAAAAVSAAQEQEKV